MSLDPGRLPVPTDLRCEYLREPLGIGIPHPRFSWILSYPRKGQKQKAYRIIVSSGRELSLRKTGDIWDSGEIESPRSFGIPYDGKPLKSCKRYWWRIMWRNASGESSNFSEPTIFGTGIFNNNEWQAKWITMRNPEMFSSRGTVMLGQYQGDYVQYLGIYLRKEVTLKADIACATAFVSGLGFYELRINGHKVGDAVLDPGQTDYNKTALYSTFDVTGKLERNSTIGLILGSGRHIENFGYGKPKAFLQIEIEYVDGGRDVVVTDDSWRASHGPLRENGLYYGEHYDARMEMTGWDDSEFYENNWEKALEVEGPPLSSQMMPPIRVEKTIKPQRLYSPKKGIHIFDFGRNLSGWAQIKVSGPSGTKVQLRYAELVNEDGTLNTATNDGADATDSYILKGRNQEMWEPRFTCHGFRFVEVTGYSGALSLDSLAARFVHSEADRCGRFKCSNELINRIHENVVRGQLSNLMSIPTDCPQRDERLGWLGDAHLTAEGAIFNFDLPAFYSNFIREIRLAQESEGGLPDIVPRYIRSLYPADPAWGAAFITLAWTMYLHYGDERILEENYDSMCRYVSFLRSQADGNIQRTLGKYGDWCSPGSIASKKTPVDLVATWYYFHDVLHLGRIAAVLGKKKDEKIYNSLTEKIKAAFNDSFLGESGYAALHNGPMDFEPSQTSNLLPLHLDLVPDDRRQQVIDTLVDSVVRLNDYHLDTGMIGTRYLLEVLCENGHAEAAYKIAAQESYPGWGYMIAEGATTLWERWEKREGGGMNSQNHIMLGSVDAWFYKYLAGLKPASAGWSRISILPHPLGDLDHVEAETSTPLGKLAVSWQRSKAQFELTADIPVGAEAEIGLPLFWKEISVYESGKKIWPERQPSAQLTVSGVKDDRVFINTGSGKYHFLILAK
ncbi:MAG TPA: family 78 glycoside hydrolase catalytic domain [Acidobacteriota bacterium]|nr:family 78 glycoside hydrolase catalytic domain [Acidobacteriota bacterium]